MLVQISNPILAKKKQLPFNTMDDRKTMDLELVLPELGMLPAFTGLAGDQFGCFQTG